MLGALANDLGKLEQLVAEGDGDSASALLLEYDSRLRDYLALPHKQIDTNALRALTIRHAQLLQQMSQSRDEAAGQLRAMRNSRQAVAAYQTARS